MVDLGAQHDRLLRRALQRITIAIGEAIDDGVFDDGPRMERLDVAFARRYFEALNSYFYPEDGGTPTLPWEVAFVGDRRNDKQSTMLQHMLTGVNAHITFDLGLAAVAIAPDALAPLEGDFNRVNAVLCSQIPGMLDVVEHLSPAVRDIRRVVPAEVLLLKRMLVKLRTSAWYFALATALRPQHARRDPRRSRVLDLGDRDLVCAAAVSADRLSRTDARDRQTGKPRRRGEHPGAGGDHRQPGQDVVGLSLIARRQYSSRAGHLRPASSAGMRPETSASSTRHPSSTRS